MVIILVLAFLLSATVTIYILFRSGDTRVPNLVGKPEAEAQKAAEQAGLKVKIQRRADDKVPANTVIETRPGPNSSVKKDSSLTIIISNGPSTTRSEAKQETDILLSRLDCHLYESEMAISKGGLPSLSDPWNDSWRRKNEKPMMAIKARLRTPDSGLQTLFRGER
jgi:hypothetical protein